VTLTKTKIAAATCKVYYGDTPAIKDCRFEFQDKTVTALSGPSGCANRLSALFNRMND